MNKEGEVIKALDEKNAAAVIMALGDQDAKLIISIKDKPYLPEQQRLIAIWAKYRDSVLCGIGPGAVTFMHKRPKNPKTNRRRIAGLKAECITYLKEDQELIKMEEMDFIALMAKAGIKCEVKIVEAQDEPK